MTFNKSLHSWAFLLESEYDPNNITLSHYEVNTITLKEVGEDEHIEYRNLEWTGDILPELDTWVIFQNPADAASFLRNSVV
tara:strand:+ start:368 stop:610 length:243 start_codon:yes stop_codon:yes gene_type:complete